MATVIKPAAWAETDEICARLQERPRVLHHKRIRDQERGHSLYLFAWVDRRPVGHVIVRWPAWPERPGSSEWQLRYRCCFVEDLWVRPDSWNQGAGRALMRAVHEACRERGHRAVGLHVGLDAGYRAARHIYDTTGYRDFGHGRFIESSPGSVEPVVFLLKHFG